MDIGEVDRVWLEDSICAAAPMLENVGSYSVGEVFKQE